MTLTALEEHLRKNTKKTVCIKLNNNQKTMLSVVREKKKTSVSLHHLFLDAPTHIWDALVDFIHNKRSQKPVFSRILRSFIHEKLSSLPQQEIDIPIITQGRYHQLDEILQECNQKFFNNSLSLSITWYGHPAKSKGSSTTLGEYVSHLRLIKIHRSLDSAHVPHFFIRYVVFHEMLHHIFPIEQRGERFCIHSKAFKQQEQLFPDYSKAIEWKRRHKKLFFR